MPNEPPNIIGGIALPGETVVAAALNFAAVNRSTMSQANRDAWDALGLRIATDAYSVWRKLWTDAGALK